MKRGIPSTLLLAGASALALTSLVATPSYADSYIAGDFHNHTNCNDGSTAVQTMVTTSLNRFGLDWLGDSGHGGTATRDCRFDDLSIGAQFLDVMWPASLFKGDTVTGSDGHRAMWIWQILQDLHYPITMTTARPNNKSMTYLGTELNAPGHEHVSTAIVNGQGTWIEDGTSNARAMAEFEYRFDRSDTDTSGGAPDNKWTGKIANATGPNLGTLNHTNKTVVGVSFLQSKYPITSYFVPAHVERAGVFDPSNNRGFNVEHFRDFNNAGPTVAFGFETQPGHQASNTRGEYRANFGGPGIDSVGVTTYGGTGIYGARIGGLWDALLGEGRNWFFYASSDFHARGIFSPFVRQSTADFYPGEYTKTYILSPTPAVAGDRLTPTDVVKALRTGNVFTVMGDLITGDLTYTASTSAGTGSATTTATMGQTLVVPRGQSVTIRLTFNDPITPNNSPYSFNNPSLAQVGISSAINQPDVDHVDFIAGDVTGVIDPSSANYTNATNTSARVIATFNSSSWSKSGTARTMTFTIPNIQRSQYVRARGTNLPPGVPFETDAAGNPLSDLPTSAIPCLDPACPSHMQVVDGIKRSSFDVASWSDLWFYLNPIFIRVSDDAPLLVEKNATLARSLDAVGR